MREGRSAVLADVDAELELLGRRKLLLP